MLVAEQRRSSGTCHAVVRCRFVKGGVLCLVRSVSAKQKLVDEYFLPRGLSAVPVVQGDYLIGFITLSDIVHVESERWSYTPVGHVMHLLERVHVATPKQPLQEVLQMMVEKNVNQVPVLQDGRLVGLVSRESLVRYLQVRQSLSQNERFWKTKDSEEKKAASV